MKSSTAISLRVQKLLDLSGMTRYRLCRKIAISETTLKHIIDQEYKSVNFDTINDWQLEFTPTRGNLWKAS